MARVTVEDCLDNVDNRFQLVLVASKRARQISNGKEPMVEWENDKSTVVALREIAEGMVTRDILNVTEEAAVVEDEITAEGGEAPEAEAATAQPQPQPSDEIVDSTAENPVLKNEDE